VAATAGELTSSGNAAASLVIVALTSAISGIIYTPSITRKFSGAVDRNLSAADIRLLFGGSNRNLSAYDDRLFFGGGVRSFEGVNG
jgi:hypothetical protein